MNRQRTFKSKFKLVFTGLMFIMIYQTCLPPSIDYLAKKQEMDVGSIYFNIADISNQSVLAVGEVTAPFFVNYLGGFYFLKDVEGNKSILCFTRKLPPVDGSQVSVLGKVKPIFQRGDINFIYLKTKQIKLLEHNMEQAALLR